MKKSESIKEISIALSKLGAELGNASKNKVNPFYKSRYADLASILNYVKHPLSQYGLSVVQSSRNDKDKFLVIETLLTHISGEWIETELEIPATQKEKHDAQTVGIAVTYGRRYALSAILNISSEEDNDGNQVPDKQPDKPVIPVSDYIKARETLETAKTLDSIDIRLKKILACEWPEKEKEALTLLYSECKTKLITDSVSGELV